MVIIKMTASIVPDPEPVPREPPTPGRISLGRPFSWTVRDGADTTHILAITEKELKEMSIGTLLDHYFHVAVMNIQYEAQEGKIIEEAASLKWVVDPADFA